MEKLLFKFELKKLLSQTSTKIIALILILFPVIIVFGIVSPSPQFSITMDEFVTPADFSNAILGFLNSLGFYYIILVVLSASSLSKEIESNYLYFVLSTTPKCSKLFFYKTFAISLIFTTIITLSSISGYVAYSALYLKAFTFTTQTLGILLWGILISFLITLIYMMILTICNLLTGGSIFASLTIAIATIIVLIVAGAIKGVMYFLPAWALDYLPTRNNFLLVGIYIAGVIISTMAMYLCTKRKSI